MDDISNNWDNEGIKNASLIEVKNLPRLRALHLHVLDACVLRKGMFDSGNLRSRQGRLFQNLQELKLVKLDNLEMTCRGRLTTEAFGKLRSIRVGSCNRLKNIFSFSIARRLEEISVVAFPSLKVLALYKLAFSETLMQPGHLEIVDCPDMEEIIAVIKEQPGGSRKILFPKLRYFKFKNLQSLKAICAGGCNIECETLLEIQIESCPQLKTFTSKVEQPFFDEKYLLPFATVESLKHLKKLKVWLCSVMEQIVAKAVGEEGRSENISFPKLESLELVYFQNSKRQEVEERDLVFQQPLFNEKVTTLED
ncbi:hypothetical protein TIFTF001_003636 [Ficus carica]|uniref:Disease resistance protein At4g27190-like leucine-rich repeats domain-containing protein n=1 Tax=Ficus carica TaxID=3494 RepID=A0AA87ZUI6_FICCA|nr:hypothetical protein TIFTF001_003636 [Ficus carica]